MRNTLSSSFKFLIFIALLFLPASCTYNYNPDDPALPDAAVLNPVNDWMYRGSQPKEGDFSRIKAKGIRTVVNFRNEPGWVEWEKERVEKLGMKYVNLPWTIVRSVKPELLDDFFKVLDDPKNRPVLIHCKHGRDRTGVMTTLALMRYDKRTEADAREFALGTIRPHRRYQYFVSKKIDFFIKERPSLFFESPAPDQKTPEPTPKASVSSPAA